MYVGSRLVQGGDILFGSLLSKSFRTCAEVGFAHSESQEGYPRSVESTEPSRDSIEVFVHGCVRKKTDVAGV